MAEIMVIYFTALLVICIGLSSRINMYYDFKCKECDHEQGVVFSIHDYDKKVAEGGRLKRTRCENCKSISLYRHMIVAPNILGGPGGYVSMERYQRQHPENTSRLKRDVDKKKLHTTERNWNVCNRCLDKLVKLGMVKKINISRGRYESYNYKLKWLHKKISTLSKVKK